jgi:hypothetical protein
MPAVLDQRLEIESGARFKAGSIIVESVFEKALTERLPTE